MPRVGKNPMKWSSGICRAENITVTTIVYVPFLGGYWEQSLEVLGVCINSLRESTAMPFDLLVFDNGSCGEVQHCLLDLKSRGIVQFLVLSKHNIGKVGAWNFILSAAPGDLVAYMDSDVLFLPGWLEASVEVLRAFPKAGMITAQPARGLRRFSTTLTEAQEDVAINVETGDFIPETYLTAHRHGLGDTEEEYQKRCRSQQDIKLSKGGISAYVTASHFQFLTTRDALRRILPLEPKVPVGDETCFDVSLDEAGYWRLATTDYLVHHMGNTVLSAQNGYDGISWLRPEDLPIRSTVNDMPSSRNGIAWNPLIRYLLGRSRVKHLLRRLNIFSYKLLTE
jgi:glycosyltransferase involved in cell wall biosynthesis